MSKKRKLTDMKISEIDDKDLIRGFIATASMGLSHKDEILEKHQLVEQKIDDYNSRLGELEDATQRWERISESADSKEAYTLSEEYGTEEDILARYKTLEKERNQWASYLTELETLIGEYKNFNKTLCSIRRQRQMCIRDRISVNYLDKTQMLKSARLRRRRVSVWVICPVLKKKVTLLNRAWNSLLLQQNYSRLALIPLLRLTLRVLRLQSNTSSVSLIN